MNSKPHPDTTQQNQELKTQIGSDQRIETEEQSPEKAFDVITMNEKKESRVLDAGARKDLETSKTLRIPLMSWKVDRFFYSAELQGYLTFYEFTRRIEKFNAFSHKFRINQVLMIFPWILLCLILIISITPIKNHSHPESVEKIICGIFLLIISGIFVCYWFFSHKRKQRIKYLNMLLDEYNEEDIPKNINWKLTKSDKYVNNRYNKMCLTIELGPLPTYQKQPPLQEVPRVITIHDYNGECYSDSIRNSIFDIRESIGSINSVDIENIQIRTAVRIRNYYETMPNIPPPAYCEGIGINRCSSNATCNGVGVDNKTSESNDNSVNINGHLPESEYYEMKLPV